MLEHAYILAPKRRPRSRTRGPNLLIPLGDEAMKQSRSFLLGTMTLLLGCGEAASPPQPPGCAVDMAEQSFGDNVDQIIYTAGLSLVADETCHVVFTGMAEKPIDLGGGFIGTSGEPFTFVAKLDQHGKHVWSRALPPGARVIGKHPLAVDAKGDIVLGGSVHANVDFGGGALGGVFERSSDLFLLGLDADGNHRFSKRFAGNLPNDKGYAGGFYRQVESIAMDADGNIVIAGTFIGTVDLDGTMFTSIPLEMPPQPTNYKEDVLVAKFNREGTLLWGHQFGGNTIDRHVGLDLRPSGEVLLVYSHFADTSINMDPLGMVFHEFGPGGESVKTNFFEGSYMFASPSLMTTPDGGFVIGGAGNLDLKSKGVFEPAFVARLSSQDTLLVGATVESDKTAVVSAVWPEETNGLGALGWFGGALVVQGKVLANAKGDLEAFALDLTNTNPAGAATTWGTGDDPIAVAMAKAPSGEHVVLGLEGPVQGLMGFDPSVVAGGRRMVLRMQP